ncbi:LacI family DNA-binding transcriptional regulator [Ancylobacter lacus]|uniref:LacI family DNA-binding transcriptional regulator n=1 Tax=Ancylobacter lacus TaxID=2579970 RepID=UPI001BCF5639|nr:substrate-binding domain-containing protein [Ancylobacter lacus]MBS7540645.1 substrate-binding domain-containing protein [Ancylobacter lacus]
MHEQGRALLTYCHGQKPDVMDQALDFFTGQRVAALVLSGADCLRDKLVRLADRGLPIICFNNDIEGVPMQRVFVNNRDAARRAVGHLIDLGHSRIAVLSGDLSQSTARERLEGYHQAMAGRGLAVDDRLVGAGSWRPSLAYAALSDLLDGPQKPTALFSSSAGMTFGALQLLADRGLRVPDDISLIGFDDSVAFRLREHPLTVIQQPLDRIAGAIGELLAAHLEADKYLAPGTLRFDCDLITRRSCGRLPA